ERRRRPQHILRPGDEAIDHRAQALDLAPALRAGGDMRLGRGNLAGRQRLERVGGGELCPVATVETWAHRRRPGLGGSRLCWWSPRCLGRWRGEWGALIPPPP